MSRVIRGGSWFHESGYVFSANRLRAAPGDRDSLLGFRLAEEDFPSLLVLRGGSWINSPRRVSSVFRERDERTYCGYFNEGFRLLQDTTSAQRMIQGGSWRYIPGYERSAYRYRSPPDYRLRDLGFRLAEDK